MRLYCDAESKNGITYTPDSLVVETGDGSRMELDIIAETDIGGMPGMHTRSKGEFPCMEDDEEEYSEMTERQKQKLINMLTAEDKDVFIVVYPHRGPGDKSMEETPDEVLDTDLLTECQARIQLMVNGEEKEVDFKFHTECYYE